MKIGGTVNFKKESLNIPGYLEFFHTFVPFSPERLSTDEGGERTLTGEAIESLIPDVWNQYFILSGKDHSIPMNFTYFDTPNHYIASYPYKISRT
ncbi:hypothetical protein [Chitinophaga sp. LS1]|uniref:hypothetical protein n=1 Tax=Chitinophaga sp. LS1 TaxID=3051176 RepID=UPI002AABFCB5|nr:hypothetical protein [Chitinophaga sp. LS1]WPV63865.1 hypothetical protein QQL36_18875 [Chitinophaga sp. LS1]